MSKPKSLNAIQTRFRLEQTEEGLALLATTSNEEEFQHKLLIDFINDPLSYCKKKHRGANELIGKAIGLAKGYRDVLDLTLGLAQDAFFLIQLGCRVIGIERSQPIYELLIDAQNRALSVDEDPSTSFLVSNSNVNSNSILTLNSTPNLKSNPNLNSKLFRKEWAQNLKIIHMDAFSYLKDLPSSLWPEVIYMDPMYPLKKKTALPRLEMQIFREIVGDDLDAEELLKLARQRVQHRVVCKRPLRAPPLESDLIHSYKGKTIRFDVYSPQIKKG